MFDLCRTEGSSPAYNSTPTNSVCSFDNKTELVSNGCSAYSEEGGSVSVRGVEIARWSVSQERLSRWIGNIKDGRRGYVSAIGESGQINGHEV